MRFLMTLLIVFSASAHAQVSRDEAVLLIDEMVKSNMISAEEAEKAKARIPAQLENKNDRSPASVTIGEPTSDLAKEQLSAIESDLSVIAPHYSHVPQKSVREFLGM
jgi:polyhydroxyalkanoate synthesis regulator phasin